MASAGTVVPPRQRSLAEILTSAFAAVGSLAPKFLQWIRYLYFLRFSLFLWTFPVQLIGLKRLAASLVSGIMVPEYMQGYLCAGFFIVSTGFASLIAARVVVINGAQRWSEEPPEGLQSLLASPDAFKEWRAPVLSQVWALYLMGYLIKNGDSKNLSPWMIFWGLVGGSALSLLFWYVINAWYYLAYRPSLIPIHSEPEGELHEGRPARTHARSAARTILFPRGLFFLPKAVREGKSMVCLTDETEDIEDAEILHVLSSWIVRPLGRLLEKTPGYTYKTETGPRLYEGHAFALFGTSGFIALYLLIWPLAAPVPTIGIAAVMLLGALGTVLLIVREFAKATLGGKKLRLWKIPLCASVVLAWIAVLWLYVGTSAERFPILAVVLIMVTAMAWALSGVAFLVDLYRIPVFTIVVLNVILFHVLVYGDRDEHYFSSVPAAPGVTLQSIPTPAAILDDRLQRLGADKPFVIVTATGGGLHASAWTAAVLAQLESEFVKNGEPPLHDRLLVISTVSGGSEGLNAYLHVIQNGTVNDEGGRQHMQQVAQCSSLEAVGWGLVYYDFPKAMLPFGPYIFPESDGVGDLDRSPLFKDRTWSLRKAFERNQNNAYCEDIWNRDMQAAAAPTSTGAPAKEGSQQAPGAKRSIFRNTLFRNLRDKEATDSAEAAFTLTRMLPSAASAIPAFAMNTTTVEQGDRFLLSNYVVPHYALDADTGNTNYPAQSFLDTYAVNGGVADIPLATAAQMSATFPYVSSAARAPLSIANNPNQDSVHFADGGFYDNDGTNSAVEFLRYALAPAKGGATSPDEQKHLENIQQRLKQSPLHIIWIEIRNSGDFDGGASTSPGGNGASKSRWNLADQVNAPLVGFWNAGHESVTGRNRTALDLLSLAYRSELSIHRIVIPDFHSQEVASTDPLNWSLTPIQRQEVRSSACKYDMRPKYDEATQWMAHWPPTPLAPVNASGPPPDVCTIPGVR